MWNQWYQLRQSGVITQAVVIDSVERCYRDSEGDERCTYTLIYRFEVTLPRGDSKSFTQTEEVSSAMYDHYNLNPSSTVTIRYMADNPAMARIEGNEWRYFITLLGQTVLVLGWNLVVGALIIEGVRKIRIARRNGVRWAFQRRLKR